MTGVTSAERYLSQLARRSFLSMWSYSNLFRDQFDAKSGSTVGKEVCDLVVVFGRHVLLFSDKDCAYPAHADPRVAWRRWYRRAVASSATQLYGAQRWFVQHPDRVFVDASCTEKLPIPIPPDAVFHRVAVVHSVAEPCRDYFGGGSGSLVYDSEVAGEGHVNEACEPFRVGLIEAEKGYVHVLDDTTLDVLLRELDTVHDFVAYLDKKERLVERMHIVAPGEEELLANYLSRVDERGEHNFDFGGPYVRVVIDEGHWHGYLNHPQTRRKKVADQDSYIWDRLIEEFARHAIGGTQHFASHPGIGGAEPGLRMMAQLGRFERRILGKALAGFFEQHAHQDAHKAVRVLMPQNRPGLAFVFLLLPTRRDKAYETYREVRRKMLELHCLGLRVLYPNLTDIVGLAFDAGSRSGGSEDLLYLDGRTWDEARNPDIREMMQEADVFQSGIQHRMRKFRGQEYPEAPRPGRPMKGRDANRPCPCGSGQKFKRCCGRR